MLQVNTLNIVGAHQIAIHNFTDPIRNLFDRLAIGDLLL